VKWGVDAILTDVTQQWLDLRAALADNYTGTMARQDRSFLWRVPRFWLPVHLGRRWLAVGYIELIGGPLDSKAIKKGVVEQVWSKASFAYGLLIFKLFPPHN
jgi:hypothetical protein